MNKLKMPMNQRKKKQTLKMIISHKLQNLKKKRVINIQIKL